MRRRWVSCAPLATSGLLWIKSRPRPSRRVHAVNGFLNHDELDDKLRDKLAETINVAEFLRLIADTVGLESYLALLVVPGTARAVGKFKAKRIISERNISWAKGHVDFYRQPWQGKAAEHSINNPADLVSRLEAMNQDR